MQFFSWLVCTNFLTSFVFSPQEASFVNDSFRSLSYQFCEGSATADLAPHSPHNVHGAAVSLWWPSNFNLFVHLFKTMDVPLSEKDQVHCVYPFDVSHSQVSRARQSFLHVIDALWLQRTFCVNLPVNHARNTFINRRSRHLTLCQFQPMFSLVSLSIDLIK